MQYNLFKCFVSTHVCLLPHARNAVIRGVLEKHPEFDYLLFIDDDMSNFGPAHVLKLVQANKPIITAITTMRYAPYSITAKFTKEEQDEKKIVEYIKNEEVRPVGHVGMAFTLIRKDVIDATGEDTEDGKVWFSNDRWPRENFSNEIDEFLGGTLKELKFSGDSLPEKIEQKLREAIAMGQTSHIGQRCTGEDVAFCLKSGALGFQSYIHCGVSVGHVGDKCYDIGTNVEYNNNPDNVKHSDGEHNLRICSGPVAESTPA